MFVVVAGAGKLGANLALQLLAEGHEVTAIEERAERVRQLAEQHASLKVIHGDACEPVVLESAHVSRADIVAAVTGHDEDNLVICLLARREYGVGTTVARVNDPRNEWLFDERFGVDHTVSSTRTIADLITADVEE